MSKKCSQLKKLRPSIIHLVEGVKSHPKLAAGKLPKPPFPLHLRENARRMWHDKKKLSVQHPQPFGSRKGRAVAGAFRSSSLAL